MRIQIDASPIGPLKVLRELPDARLAILEGLNGIGKTLTVRLLQLCTGTHPYPPKSAAWASLRNGLGEFTVMVSGLRGGHEIRWHADSRDWEEESADGSTPASFREVWVDGRFATMDEVRALLAVHRVGGDIGIVETLALQADLAAETIQRWARRYTDEREGPLARLEVAAGDSMRLLGLWSLGDYRRLVSSAEDAQIHVTQAAKEVAAAQRKRDQLTVALELRERLREMQRRGPDLASRLKLVDERIRTVEGEREDLQRKVRVLAGQLGAAQPLHRELNNARRTAKRNRDYLSQELNAAASVAAALHISPGMDAVMVLMGQLDEQLAELSIERAAIDAAPMMRNLLDQVTGELTQAEAKGLGDQIAVDDPVAEVQLTVSQTNVGMTARRAYLEGKPPPPQAQDVIERQERAVKTLAGARHLRVLLDEVERLRRLVTHNEERVRLALSKINPDAVVQIEELEAERRKDDDRLLELAAERAALGQQLGVVGDGTTVGALAMQFHDALQRAGVSEADLEASSAQAEATLHTVQLTLTEAQERVAETRRELVRARGEVSRASTALAVDDRLSWIRSALPAAIAPSDTETPPEQLTAIDAAREGVARVTDRLGELRSQLGAVETALRGVGHRLRGEDPQTVRYLDELQSWWSQHFSSWFNNPRVRKELLPTAEGNVDVDVGNREVIWNEKGSRRARPLEAFSSGEQAFAYTRARLAVLDEEEIRPSNRLIVLDEFGAFIAHDRLAGLLAHLRDRAHEHPEDQVLVVLPLSRDYAELATSAYGVDAERFSKLAEEIDKRGYAARVLEA